MAILEVYENASARMALQAAEKYCSTSAAICGFWNIPSLLGFYSLKKG